MGKIEKRKAVTRGVSPQAEREAQAVAGILGSSPRVRAAVVPGSLEDMLSGGERPPELVFLAVVRIYDDGRVADGGPGEGFRTTVEANYFDGGMCMSAVEGLGSVEEGYDVASRLLRSACVEAEELDGIMDLPKG